jgi:Fe-Mn family superoxide dismutase
MTTKQLLLKTARSPSEASLFNHASMAHNNKFFFDCISSKEEAREIPISLRDDLTKSFSSIETLKKEFIATANAMFGPGFVWLVKHDGTKYSILTTYLAGSPYAGAHWRRQTIDMNTQNSVRTAADLHRHAALLNSAPTNTVGAHGPTSASGRLAPGGINIMPVLCVNTWEHVWVGDWGIRGKKDFLEAWWDRINWDVVHNNAQVKPSSFMDGAN